MTEELDYNSLDIWYKKALGGKEKGWSLILGSTAELEIYIGVG